MYNKKNGIWEKSLRGISRKSARSLPTGKSKSFVTLSRSIRAIRTRRYTYFG